MTVSLKHHMLYMWNVFKYFEEFEQNAEVLMQVLMTHAVQTKNMEMAFLMRAVCRTGKRHFRHCLATPRCLDYGDLPPPLFKRVADKVAWAFTKCHFCIKKAAVHRCTGLVAFRDATTYTTLACETCVPRGCVLLLRHPVKTMSGCLMFSRNSQEAISYVKNLIRKCKITASHIGAHTWTGVINRKTTSQYVLLTSVCIDLEDGSKPLHMHIPLKMRHHNAAFGKGAIHRSTVNNFGAIFEHVLLKGGGHAIVNRIVAWVYAKNPKQNSRKQQHMKCIKKRCTHQYTKPFRGANLVHCTFCDTVESE